MSASSDVSKVTRREKFTPQIHVPQCLARRPSYTPSSQPHPPAPLRRDLAVHTRRRVGLLHTLWLPLRSPARAVVAHVHDLPAAPHSTSRCAPRAPPFPPTPSPLFCQGSPILILPCPCLCQGLPPTPLSCPRLCHGPPRSVPGCHGPPQVWVCTRKPTGPPRSGSVPGRKPTGPHRSVPGSPWTPTDLYQEAQGS